ncbi:UNVERIFIED_CONTAM: hypothetical protein RMT77_008668 [Armadillidium vulgare]
MGDLFDAIEDIEKDIILHGEREGRKHAEQKDFQDGFIQGWQQACHIQRELGMINGFLCSVLENSSTLKSKDKTTISKLLAEIEKCDEWDSSNEKELENKLSSIHSKAKFIFKKLNVNSVILNREIDSEF